VATFRQQISSIGAFAMKMALAVLVLAGMVIGGSNPNNVMAQPATVVPLQNNASDDALKIANELVALKSNEALAQVVSQSWAIVQAKIGKSKLDKETLAALKAEFDRIQRETIAAISKKAPAIYARHFTAAELRDLLAFYKTPTGQKVLREEPSMLAELRDASLPRVGQVQLEMIRAAERISRQRAVIK
jgi:hypothetical protein